MSGAPPDGSGQPTNKAAVDWLLMGAEEGTRDMTWHQEITLVYICRIRMRLYVIKSLNDIYMSNNF